VRKVIGATFVTLDGVMQSPSGPEEDANDGFAYGGWQVPHSDDAVGEVVTGVMNDPFDLLLGRRTYEIFAAYWPFRKGAIADKFNAATKYVATSAPDEALTWSDTVPLRGDVAAKIAKLKEQEGPNLLVQGSSVLYQTLLENDLLDDLTLLVYPVVLGTGKRLFGTGTVPAAFELVSSRTSPTGVIVGSYRRSGDVQTGQPGELERRARIKQEV
jgi:dihydrofolate reductase